MKKMGYTVEELRDEKAKLQGQYNDYKKLNLDLNVSRGLPSTEQLDLNDGMFGILTKEDVISQEGFDTRNYGCMYGLIECKRLFSDLLGIPAENIVIGGNSSMNLIYDEFVRLYLFGANGEKPWCKQEKLKFLCPVPGYDCHFNVTEKFGFEMINIPTSETGPDMDLIESLVKEDPTIKGIWCVPLYSNPQGCCYSDETVERLVKMETAAKDFKIFWDNAYAVHPIYEKVELANIFELGEKYGTTDRILYFFSTAKITFPGACVSMIASGTNSLEEIKEHLKTQIFSYDKLNQIRHVKYLKSPEHIHEHMGKMAAALRPKFDYLLDKLDAEFGGTQFLTWTRPLGGYFVTVDTYPHCATRVLELLKSLGIMFANPGATYPYKKDPNDSNIRIAPTYQSMEQLQLVIPIFCTCVKLAGVERLLKEQNEDV